MVDVDHGLPNKNVFVDSKFLIDAFAQVKDIPDPKGSFQGKWFQPIFDGIFEPYDDRLAAFDSNLPGWVLRPVDSFNTAEYSFWENLSETQRKVIDEVRGDRQAELTTLVDEKVIPIVQKQILPVGIFEVPRYYQQQNKRGCAAANFCMVFEDLTGDEVTEDAIYQAGRVNGIITEETGNPGEVIAQENYAKIYQTQSFKQRYPDHLVRVIPIWGADFEDLQLVLGRLGSTAKNSELKAYCIASVSSEVTQNGWHELVILSADENYVDVHDPSNKVGGANRRIPKDEFMRRWGKTFFRSEIIIGITSTKK